VWVQGFAFGFRLRVWAQDLGSGQDLGKGLGSGFWFGFGCRVLV
jgi:hypothetical protein